MNNEEPRTYTGAVKPIKTVVTIGKPQFEHGPAKSLHMAAKDIMRDARKLATCDGGRGLAMLIGQVLECLLRSYLARSLPDTEDHDRIKKDSKTRHNLVKLWELCAADGLDIDATVPTWVQELGGLHGSFTLRYWTRGRPSYRPALPPMVAELETILEKVCKVVR